MERERVKHNTLSAAAEQCNDFCLIAYALSSERFFHFIFFVRPLKQLSTILFSFAHSCLFSALCSLDGHSTGTTSRRQTSYRLSCICDSLWLLHFARCAGHTFIHLFIFFARIKIWKSCLPFKVLSTPLSPRIRRFFCIRLRWSGFICVSTRRGRRRLHASDFDGVFRINKSKKLPEEKCDAFNFLGNTAAEMKESNERD